jgi:DNA-binding MarR family transcriptional regulator
MMHEAEKHDPEKMSFHQFRTMMFIGERQHANLSLIADHLKVTMSFTSKLVDALVQDGYLKVETPASDRRFKVFSLTDQGESVLRAKHQNMVHFLAQRLQALSDHECNMLGVAMDILRTAFMTPQVIDPKVLDFIQKKIL